MTTNLIMEMAAAYIWSGSHVPLMDRFVIPFGVTLVGTKLPWIMTLVWHLVHFCQIRIVKQVTFRTNVKQSVIEHNTNIIQYSKTPPTQNSIPNEYYYL